MIVNSTKEEVLYPSTTGPDALGHVTDPVGGGMLSYLFIDDPTSLAIEATDNAGRWAGDDVRVVGDYAENDLHYALADDWECRIIATDDDSYAIGDTFQKTPPTSKAPIRAPPELRSGQYIKRTPDMVYDREPTEGEIAHVKHPDPPYKRVYAEITEITKSNYIDITDDVRDEFERVVGGDWVDSFKDSARVIPTGMVGATDDGDTFFASGDEVALILEGADGYQNTTVEEYINTTDSPDGLDAGEYVFVNAEQREYLAPETGNDATGVTAQLTNATGTGMVVFLLLEGKQDGTRFTKLYNHHSLPEHIEEDMQEKMAEQRERYRNTGLTSSYRNDDGSWKKSKLASVVAAGYTIAEENRFAGRWAGDGVEVMRRDDVPAEFTDITPGTFREYEVFAGSDWIENHSGSSIMRIATQNENEDMAI